MKLRNLLLTILNFSLLVSCSDRAEVFSVETEGMKGAPCEVSLCLPNAENSKTAIASDAHSVYWEDGDQLALWAVRGGVNILSAQPFTVYGRTDTRAFFSSTLAGTMPDGQFLYWAASPLPSRTQGSNAWFAIPSVQDGKGAGVMTSENVVAGPLRPKEEYSDAEQFSLEMAQRLHLLRFYLEDSANLLAGETVERMILTWPSEVTGNLKQAIASAWAPTLEDGNTNLELDFETPLQKSTSSRKYAYATIFPQQWGIDDVLSVKFYTQTMVGFIDEVPLCGRNMQGGHATSVQLVPDRVGPYCRVFVTLQSNPLGEDLQSVTLTAPSGSKWGDRGSNTYTWTIPEGIKVGDSFVLEYEDAAKFRTLSGKSVTVTFDSEHVQTSQTLSVANLSSVYSTSLNLNVPPLLDENFSGVSTFSSNDEYSSGFNTGSKDPHTFLNGWAGARCGASAGKCVRIASRRETSARYGARVDAAPLTGTLKKATNLKVTFDYGANNQFSSLGLLGNGDVGQTCYVGYITTTDNYKSSETTGTYQHNFHIDAGEKTGSWDNTPNDAEYVLSNVPANTTIRISWRNETDSKAGAHNTTSWFYLDNVKVTIQP
ncbi:MAG: hypothetical protein J6Y32_07155 [Bacteroidales bacterium]|nr:hypothetical protein [Bacteroidales bacterium]